MKGKNHVKNINNIAFNKSRDEVLHAKCIYSRVRDAESGVAELAKRWKHEQLKEHINVSSIENSI